MLLLFKVLEVGLDKAVTKDPALEDDDKTRRAKIRCPRCAWVPGATDRWMCSCGFMWNTFDTHGLCPACQYQWKDTACPACCEWSPHDDWYVR